MKLKNLMYATMVACAFASCSKDDVPEIPTPGTEGDVTLSMKVAAPLSTAAAPLSTVAGALSTRSIGSVAEGDADAKITSLTTYVFDKETSLLEAIGTTMPSANEVKTEKMKAGTKKVIVLANVTPTQATIGTTTYDAFIGQSLKNLANEKNGSLSMNSQVFDVVLKAGVVNYLGYSDAEITDGGNKVLNVDNVAVSEIPVKLFRNVAKVVLQKVTLSKAHADRYPDASFKIEAVYILNGRSTTNLVGAAGKPWGPTMSTASAYENGMTGADYAAWVAKFEATGKSALFSYLTGNYETAKFTAYEDLKNITLQDGNLSTDANNAGTALEQFYVYENTLTKRSAAGTDANTLLVVQGKFMYKGLVDAESRYYTVAVGYDGVLTTDLPADSGMTMDTFSALSGRADLTGVLRNMQYNIELTVSGPGYTTPVGPKPEDDTYLQVKVVVVPFGVVKQAVDIE